MTFNILDRLIVSAVQLHQTERLEPVFLLNKRAYISTMVNVVWYIPNDNLSFLNDYTQLLHYLRPSFSAYHMRAVNLIWSLERLNTQPLVESVIAQSLSSRHPSELQDACEAFGVLWRLTGMWAICQ